MTPKTGLRKRSKQDGHEKIISTRRMRNYFNKDGCRGSTSSLCTKRKPKYPDKNWIRSDPSQLTGSGECRRVAAHVSTPAHHLQPVQTSCLQAREHTAVRRRRHFLQVHQLTCSLRTQQHVSHPVVFSSILYSLTHLVVPPCTVLAPIGCCLSDTVQRQVVDVNMAVRGIPREGERGGVGRGDG